jgi:Brix domain
VQVEDAKRILILQGNKVSQVVKDVLGDIWKLKHGQAARLSRKNDIWPFEPGHETSLQFFCERSDCGLFCLGNHNKKRPNNLVLGRMFSAQLLDMIELGVTRHVPVGQHPGASLVQAGVKVRGHAACCDSSALDAEGCSCPCLSLAQ